MSRSKSFFRGTVSDLCLAAGAALCLAAGAAGTAQAADIYGLTEGTPELKSAGSLAFGPEGVLFIGDSKGATIFAIQTGDKGGEKPADRTIEGLGSALGELLKTDAKNITVNDLAVNPKTGNVFLSVHAGGKPAIVKVDGAGKLSRVSLDKVAFSKNELSNAPEDKEQVDGRGRKANPRGDSITDLAFVEGQVIVSGLSKEGSAVRSFLFPFGPKDQEVNLEIYHGAHGRVESMAPIRTFVPFVIDGQPHVLAGFVCTPLVKFPVTAVGKGEKVKGTTVAELGNRNRPLDMIAYKKDGKDFLLLTNSARGVMKVSTDDLEREEGITAQVSGVAGQKYDTVAELKGVVQLDKVNDATAVVIVQGEDGKMDLKTVQLP